MNHSALQILFEDNHLLAVAKPAGLATIGVADDEPSLAKLAKDYLKVKYHKPGNVYLGVMSRLDALVTGVVLFARTSKAAARLTEQFRERKVEKRYLAAVDGRIEPISASLEDFLLKDDAHHRMRVVARETAGGQFARLRYERLAVSGATSLLSVWLETGRKHQIRLQFAERGHPIVGDRKYGGRRKYLSGIALHARSLTVDHPTRHALLEIQCPLPASWQSLGFSDQFDREF